MSIKPIAIYSDEDVGSLHVKLADECYHIGPPSPSESYLNIDRIRQGPTPFIPVMDSYPRTKALPGGARRRILCSLDPEVGLWN